MNNHIRVYAYTYARIYIYTYTSCLQYNALYNAMYDVCDPSKIYL